MLQSVGLEFAARVVLAICVLGKILNTHGCVVAVKMRCTAVLVAPKRSGSKNNFVLCAIVKTFRDGLMFGLPRYICRELVY